MKFFFIPAFIFISVASFSQNKFVSQMEAIIKDTVNRFKTFEGKLNENPKMGWPYHSSKSDIEGTYDNRVNLFSIRSFYSARVVNPNKGDSILTDKLLNVWLEKLTNVLGKGFSFDTATHPAGFKAYYMRRYKFSHGNLSVFVSHERPDPRDRTNNEVQIFFEYKHKD